MSASLIILLSKLAVKGVYGNSVSTDFSDIDTFLSEFSIKESLAEAPANLYYGYIAVGGKIFLMKDRIEFHPHNVLQKYRPIKINYNSIEKARPSRQFWLLLNCFSIHNKDGVEYKFVASYRKLWVDSIEFVLTPYKTGQESENRFVTVKLGKYDKSKKIIHTGRALKPSAGSRTRGLHGDMSQV